MLGHCGSKVASGPESRLSADARTDLRRNLHCPTALPPLSKPPPTLSEQQFRRPCFSLDWTGDWTASDPSCALCSDIELLLLSKKVFLQGVVGGGGQGGERRGTGGRPWA